MNEFILKGRPKLELTLAQYEELAKCTLDPIYFIDNYCWIQNQDLGKVLFKLRPYQKEIIRSLHENRFSILLIGRQSGKTETTAAYAYWYANFIQNKNVLVASNKQKGASDIMNRIRFMYENTPDFLKCGVKFYNRGSIEFTNGSKIWSEATTESTGRGRSVALFILDELAHVKKNIQEEMWSSILPTISSGENLSCVIMSTPNGDTDLFANLWRGAKSGTNGFVPVEVQLDQVPGRDDPRWQKAMEAKLGETKFRQEYKCEFLSSDPLLIKSLVLANLKHTVPMCIDKGFKIWKDIDPKKTYIVGCDVAEGLEQDFSTIQVFELETLEQVAEFRNNKINEAQLYNALKWIIAWIDSHIDPQTRKHPQVYWSFENNSIGAAIATLFYQDEKFPERPELVNGKGDRCGMRTLNKTKYEACRHLKTLMEKIKGGLKINSADLIFELKNYVASGASYAAKQGATDDLVSATLIVMRILKYLSEFEPEVFDKLYKSESEFYEETTDSFDDPIPFTMT